MFEKALVARLAEVAGVTVLLGTGSAMRVYPQAAKKNSTRPYVTYFRVSTNADQSASLEGGRATVAWSRVQFDVWSEQYDTAKAVEDAIRLALDGWSGTLKGVTVNSVRRVEARDFYEPDTQPPLHRAGADYLVCFNL